MHVLAFDVFSNHLKNLAAIAFRLVGDNSGAVSVLNRGRSRRDPVVAHRHRELLLLSAKRCIPIRDAVHVPGVANELADALSRQMWDKVRELTRGKRLVILQVDPRSSVRKLLLRAHALSRKTR